jgi:SOS-response transcriptional repressor LexA
MQTLGYIQGHEPSRGFMMPPTTSLPKREKRDDQINVRLPSSLKDSLGKASNASGQSMNDIVVGAVQRVLNGDTQTAAIDAQLNQKRCKYLGTAPCGPFAEALAEATTFIVSPSVADLLDVQSGDFWLMSDGDSMTGVGIEDGDVLPFKPQSAGIAPRSGAICLVQIITSEGIAKTTIKHWQNSHPLPTLTDGKGQTVSIPEDTVSIVPLGVARGLIRKF